MSLLVPHLPSQGAQMFHPGPVVVSRNLGVSQSPAAQRSKLAALNPSLANAPPDPRTTPTVGEKPSHLPHIASTNARESNPPSVRTFRDKVAMLSAIKGGGMAQYDYTRRRPAMRPVEDVDPAPTPDDVATERVHEPLPAAPPRPMLMRKGVRKPTAVLMRPPDSEGHRGF
jgi:hypothetical protein